MRMLKLMIVLHLVLGPLGVARIADDADHPERWGDWFRNPSLSVPFCIVADLACWAMTVHLWRHERRQERGYACWREALRLCDRGDHDAAEAAFREGCRILRVSPEDAGRP